MMLLLIQRAGDGCPDPHATYLDEAPVHLQNITRLDGPLGQQDHPGDEVLDDILHGEAQTDGEDRARGEEGAQTDAEVVNADA